MVAAQKHSERVHYQCSPVITLFFNRERGLPQFNGSTVSLLLGSYRNAAFAISRFRASRPLHHRLQLCVPSGEPGERGRPGRAELPHSHINVKTYCPPASSRRTTTGGLRGGIIRQIYRRSPVDCLCISHPVFADSCHYTSGELERGSLDSNRSGKSGMKSCVDTIEQYGLLALRFVRPARGNQQQRRICQRLDTFRREARPTLNFSLQSNGSANVRLKASQASEIYVFLPSCILGTRCAITKKAQSGFS